MLYTFGLKEAPKELAKKVLIFLQFKKYFEEEKNDKDEKSSSAKIDRKKKAISDKNVSKRIDKKEEKKEEKEENDNESEEYSDARENGEKIKSVKHTYGLQTV